MDLGFLTNGPGLTWVAGPLNTDFLPGVPASTSLSVSLAIQCLPSVPAPTPPHATCLPASTRGGHLVRSQHEGWERDVGAGPGGAGAV